MNSCSKRRTDLARKIYYWLTMQKYTYDIEGLIRLRQTIDLIKKGSPGTFFWLNEYYIENRQVLYVHKNLYDGA